MVDDQDECEWVNVSSVNGSPEYCRTKGHKIVVVDVVLWYLCLSDHSFVKCCPDA